MAALERDGATIHFTDHGGDGPPVLFLHSFAMDRSMFAPQIEALGADHRCITLDERGHGESRTDATFDYWDVADDALAVLDHLDVARTAVVGTSQGGFIGLRMAVRAPERVSALALLGTSAAAEDPDVAALYGQLAATWAEHGPLDELVDTVATICLGTMPAEEWKAKWREVPGAAFQRNIATLVDRDSLLDALPAIAQPTLVMHGSADGAYPVAKAEQIAGALPAAAPVVVVPDGAHFLSLTDSDAVNAALAPFLAEHA